MKRIIAFVMVLVCIFVFASCSASAIKYDHQVAKSKLQKAGYNISNYEPNYESGVIGYLHATNTQGEEIYLVYCSSTAIARSTYKYVKNLHKAKIAEIQMEMKMLDYSINEDGDVDSSTKGGYYTSYLNKEEDLDKLQQYEYGVYSNLVWYGTKQAVEDING